MDKKKSAKFIAHKFSSLEHTYKRNTLDYILSAYGEDHRSYHDETHIAGMLELLDNYKPTAVRPDIITHAILWHDVVYTTRDKEGQYRPDVLNVQDSAEAFRTHICDMKEDDQNAVSAMIMATAEHQIPQMDDVHYKGFAHDAGLFLDFDLSVFATSWENFQNNSHAIRREYNWIDKDIFCQARADILEKFSERDILYHVIPDRDVWESKARENITRSVHTLRNFEL
jgi:predicted metal-dependent HD superfamily phosphohydrolase